MADASLAITNDHLVKQVARYLGWGRTAYSSLSSDEQARMQDLIDIGKRMLYSPPLLAGEKRPHTWSFLKPYTTFKLYYDSGESGAGCSGTTLTDASEDFTAHMLGATVTFDTSGNTYTITEVTDSTHLELDAAADVDNTRTYTIHGHYVFDLDATKGLTYGFGGFVDHALGYVEDDSVSRKIRLVSEAQLRIHRSGNTNATGRPYYGTVRVKDNDGSNAPEFELVVFPSPDSNDYTVGFRYHLLPELLVGDLSVTTEVPLGAKMYGQALLAACLAAAEQEENDEEGPKTAAFARAVATAIQRDRQLMAPSTLGYDGDKSANDQGLAVYRARSVTYETS